MRVTEPKRPEDRVTNWPQLVARVPPEVHKALRLIAVEDGVSMAQLLEGIIRAYIISRRQQ